MNLCVEVRFPKDGRRKAIIVTDNKHICETLALYPESKIGITIIKKVR